MNHNTSQHKVSQKELLLFVHATQNYGLESEQDDFQLQLMPEKSCEAQSKNEKMY